MRDRVAIQAEHGSPGFTFKLVAVRVDVLHLEVNVAVLELEGRDVAISINRSILREWSVRRTGIKKCANAHPWMWSSPRICHNAVEIPIEFLWHLPTNDEVRHLPF